MPSFSTLAKLVDDVRSSFWFVPGLTMFAIVSLWLGTTWLDRHPALITQIPIASWLTITTIDSASTILTAIMGATISVVSLTFSITIVVLTLASGQFGSRLLYTFMRDHTTQLVLGAYSSTFVYALLTLRVLGSGADQYIPALTIQTAIVLMLASVLLLVYFIHHISVSLQVTTVVNAVGQELDTVIDRFFPLDAVEEIPFSGASHSTLFFAKKSGVLQAIDQRTLLKLAIRNEVQFCLCY